eukprot:1180648-Prorocentrum_minimum.AAC.3
MFHLSVKRSLKPARIAAMEVQCSKFPNREIQEEPSFQLTVSISLARGMLCSSNLACCRALLYSAPTENQRQLMR